MSITVSADIATTDLPVPLVVWCEHQIHRAAGSAWRITRATRVPSRTGRVYRITTSNPSTEHRHYYLKQFAEEETHEALRHRLDALSDIAAALHKEPALTPYVITAADPERHLLLTGEVRGKSVLALHRSVARRLGGGAEETIAAWRGVGIWLATLHHKTAPAKVSTTRASELATYATERFSAWAEADHAQDSLAASAIRAVERVATRCGTGPLWLTPCHGDVSGSNILVDGTVGLIDFDDVRFDLPALDLSQAVLEIRHLSRVLSTVPLRHLMLRAERGLVEGYGDQLPDGPVFWIQHLRNLSVLVLTLVRRRNGVDLSRVTNELHYSRTLTELRSTVRDVLDTDGEASFFTRDEPSASASHP